MELKTTREKVLEILRESDKNATVKATLEKLFPECFKNEIDDIKDFGVSLSPTQNPYMYIGRTHVQDILLQKKCFVLREVQFNWKLIRQDGLLLLIPTIKK